MKLKKILSTCLLAGASLLSVHANAFWGSDDDETLKLGYLVKQPEEPWFQTEWAFADKAAKQYNFELIKYGGT